MQLQHKSITNPTISHADNIMAAIADCHKAVKNKGTDIGLSDLNQLNSIVAPTKATFTSDSAGSDKDVATKPLLV